MTLTLLNHALKEWSIAIDALAQGETIMLLRKGGIKETLGRFTIKHQQVLLYPTFEHQHPELLKSPYAAQVTIVPAGWHPDTIKISNWAQITDILSISDPALVQALFPYHIWQEKFVSDRLHWQPQQPLYLLLLRVYQLATIQTIPYQKEYGGCRSWIDLQISLEINADLPVLNDQEYQDKVDRIKQIIS